MPHACGDCIKEGMREACKVLILHSMIAGFMRAGAAHLNGTPGGSNILLLICRGCHLAESKLDLHHGRDCCNFAAVQISDKEEHMTFRDFAELAFIAPGVGTSSGAADVAAVTTLRIVAVAALM